MRNLIFFSFIMLFTIAIQSCEEKEAFAPLSEEPPLANEDVLKSGGVSISCINVCDTDGTTACSLQGSGPNISCSCSGCKMVLRERDKSGYTQQEYQGDFDQKEVELVDLGFSTIQEKYGDQVEAIQEITIDRYDEDLVVQYFFALESGKQESILIHHNSVAEQKNNGNDTIIIDCDGACGCTEQFNILTKETSCSCQPCKMTVSDPPEE